MPRTARPIHPRTDRRAGRGGDHGIGLAGDPALASRAPLVFENNAGADLYSGINVEPENRPLAASIK